MFGIIRFTVLHGALGTFRLSRRMFDGFVTSDWTWTFLSYFMPPPRMEFKALSLCPVCVCVYDKTLTMTILLKRKRYECHIWHTYSTNEFLSNDNQCQWHCDLDCDLNNKK